MKSDRRLVKYGLMLITLSLFIDGHCYGRQAPEYYNVRQFGAAGDGMVYDTQAIQSAIDSASKNGGGVIYFPPGIYLTRTIILTDHITLHIEQGALILGSKDLNKYDPAFGAFTDSGGRKFGTALIFAENAQKIVLTGEGTIDGQGYEKFYPKKKGVYRPTLIRFIRCKSVKVENVTLLNSAAWVQHYVECEDLFIEGITVRSYANSNNDGLDVEGCTRVFIRKCNIDSEDDSIVLKALSNKPCKDVVISDCIISGLKSAIKTGTESLGGFENISISNCTIYGTRGISLLSVDGGNLNGITISNISMRDSYAVIVMRLGKRMRKYSISENERPKSPGKFNNIMIHNIQATGVTESNDFISGIPGHLIENVTLSNIRIEYSGGGKKSDSYRIIPEIPSEYPKAKMFGDLPCFGFFIRHAKNITLRDVQFTFKETDYRAAMVFDDVENINIVNFQSQSHWESAPLLIMKNAKDIRIQNSKSLNSTNTFLQVNGSSSNIELVHNRLHNVKEKYEYGPEIIANDIIKIKE